MRKVLIGEKFKNNKGQFFEIIGYKLNGYRTIKFDSGYICDAHMSNITSKNCKIKDWLSPSVMEVGIVGEPHLRYHPLYSKWKNMIYRCYNPKNMYYKYYGAKGIKMADELLNFKSFISIVEKLENYDHMLEDPFKWQIDKDLKFVDEKIYSKDTITIMTAQENQWLAMAEFHKNIYQFDLNGTFIKKYNNLLEVSQYTNFNMSCINHSIKGKYRHAYNYIWLDEENLNKLDERIKKASKPKKTNNKVVLQIDINTGKIIHIYSSVKEACLQNNKFKQANISGCCRGEQKTAYGYMWRYNED